MRRTMLLFCLAAALAFRLLVGSPAAAATGNAISNGTFGRLETVAVNRGLASSGSRSAGVLRVDLVARWGMWYPDGPGSVGLPIEAFGEAGRPLEIPGPLIRAALGTRVVVSIRNQLAHALTVHGLSTDAAASQASLRIQRGATARVSFTLDRPGVFGYYGADDGESLANRVFSHAELSGAIVVDGPHSPALDHIFILGLYIPVREPNGDPNFLYALPTINGRSFPATEHLSYVRGQRVRWAVVNLTAMNHPMHLHGFYFRLDGRNAYDEVTHAFRPGDAAELSWLADRPGTWMFHCHISDHVAMHESLTDMRSARLDPQLSLTKNARSAVAKRFHLPDRPMGGMVVAITVHPRPGDVTRSDPPAARTLGLTVDARDQESAPYPGLTKDTLTLTDGATRTQTIGNLGPTIVLTRGQPVAIAVTNRTREQTSIHWHGVALENSYYDGGSGMTMPMQTGAMSPAIDPNATFVARFAPPGAGTFMYHAHMDDGWQMGSGIDGALIVLPPHVSFDSSVDHVLMISESYERAGSPFVAINGSLTPAPLSMTAGIPQRLRIAVLTLGGQNLVASLSDGSHVLAWTPIAKDGRWMPPPLASERLATQALTIGETRDFSFTPRRPGSLTLNVYDLDNNGMQVATQRIDVHSRP